MTLHWWMHWFWVTIQFLIILGSPLPSTTVEPQAESQNRPEPGTTATSVATTTTTTATTTSSKTEVPYLAVQSSWQTSRVAKAIGVYPQSNTAAVPERQTTNIVESTTEQADLAENVTVNTFGGTFRKNGSRVGSGDSTRSWTTMLQRTAEIAERNRASGLKKDSRITWISAANKTNSSMSNEEKGGRQEAETTENPVDWNRNTNVTEKENLSVLPLQEEGPRFRLVLNKTGSVPSMLASSSGSFTNGVSVRTFNRSDDEVDADDLPEPQLLATAASILDAGASESTRLSRAHSAFSTGFQKDQAQADRQSPDYDESKSDHREERIETESSTSRSVDIAAITGSCMATVILLSTMGSVGFIMYRRRYLNPPQTLNSDKCSNPDSSGYIDDSTIRDNSEEMYSLDNDSFLNSLEAMTIQNYWTDSVKHTKL